MAVEGSGPKLESDRQVRPHNPARRVKTPTILQMEAVECGAAALGMVMAHYGLRVPLEELRAACGVSRNGSKATNMMAAARQYGFEVKGFRKEISVLKSTEMPVIIFWNFNHFVVLEGFKKDKVYLNDPAYGPRVVSESEFDDSFTGVTLVIRPGPNSQKGGSKPSVLRALAGRLTYSRSALTFVILVNVLLLLLGLIVPAFTRVFVDQYLVGGVRAWIAPLLLIMVGTALLQMFLAWLQQHYLLRFETKLAVATSARFFWHIIRLPMEFFNQRQAADVSVRVAINDRVAQLLSGDLATNALNVVLILFYVVVMARYDLVLTAVGVLIAVLNIVALRLVSRRRVDANQRMLQDRSKLISTAMSGLRMIESLKATGSESDFFARWAGHQAKAVNAEQELGILTEVLAIVPPILSAANVAVILTLGGMRVMNGELTIGSLVAFQALMVGFLAPVSQIVNLGSRLQQTEGDMARLDDVLRYPIDHFAETSAAAEVEAADSGKLAGQIELKDVTFGYSRLEPPLINGFNLTIRPGARVALVGGSGSGKSTIARLVAGLYQPWSGEIRFDGQTRDIIPRARLRNSVACVDQEIALFEGTIHDNLTMWDPTIAEADTVQAAKDAAIHEDIAGRAGGYDAVVAEGGQNFSGGQRQRLEIARALVMKPSVLLLDEATSALDPATEKRIDDNLRRRGCTCLIVAHRLSTIRDCDEIIVLDQGKVVQRGTHSQMTRAADGPYARLIKSDEVAKKTSYLDLL